MVHALSGIWFYIQIQNSKFTFNYKLQISGFPLIQRSNAFVCHYVHLCLPDDSLRDEILIFVDTKNNVDKRKWSPNRVQCVFGLIFK